MVSLHRRNVKKKKFGYLLGVPGWFLFFLFCGGGAGGAAAVDDVGVELECCFIRF